jgi:hypothetical protein
MKALSLPVLPALPLVPHFTSPAALPRFARPNQEVRPALLESGARRHGFMERD